MSDQDGIPDDLSSIILPTSLDLNDLNELSNEQAVFFIYNLLQAMNDVIRSPNFSGTPTDTAVLHRAIDNIGAYIEGRLLSESLAPEVRNLYAQHFFYGEEDTQPMLIAIYYAYYIISHALSDQDRSNFYTLTCLHRILESVERFFHINEVANYQKNILNIYDQIVNVNDNFEKIVLNNKKE